MSLEKPRFRRDLEAVPVEADGQSYIEVRDLGTGESFRFYDFEYRVALAFDGLALDKVIPWVKLSTGLELQVDQLQAFAARLKEMGFLESEASPPAASEEPALEAPSAPLATQGAASPTGGTDSTALPVLPTPGPQVPEIDAASLSGPFSRTTPLPAMTPMPVTFGPSLIAEQPLSRTRLRRSLVLFGSLGVLAAMAVLVMVMPFLFPTQKPSRPRVRALVAAPGTIFRYFDGTGVVEAVPGLMLKFPAPGRVIHMVGEGSTLAIGEVAAAIEVARPLQNRLVHQRERLAFSQQMAEAMHQVGNNKEEERQVAKVEIINARIAKTLHALADVAVVATAPGEVEKTFAREGDMVEADSPALRLRSAGFRATFEFPRNQAAQARRLAFCQVEVDGYLFDCIQNQENSDETHVSVEAVTIPPELVGKVAHLARARFDGAMVVPAAAILRTESRDEVLVVSPQARIEMRPVTVVERDTVEAIVVQGLDMGDNIIVETAPSLRPGVEVAIVP